MIQKRVLRALTLEFLRLNTHTQFQAILEGVDRLAQEKAVFPSLEECRRAGGAYPSEYQQPRLAKVDRVNLNEIVWDLLVERVLTWGKDSANEEWPWMRLTETGELVAESSMPPFHDPDAYLALLRESDAAPDAVVEQYAIEGLHAYQRGLLFAAAVMFGAAAETAVLGLLGAIRRYETDPISNRKISGLLDRPHLPEIFEVIQRTLARLIAAKTLPHSVHQGTTQHLLSLFEMIRVQRNDAVHPAAGQVSREKILLTMQSLPGALAAVSRLCEWFETNTNGA